jgi:hypothetical protein
MTNFLPIVLEKKFVNQFIAYLTELRSPKILLSVLPNNAEFYFKRFLNKQCVFAFEQNRG